MSDFDFRTQRLENSVNEQIISGNNELNGTLARHLDHVFYEEMPRFEDQLKTLLTERFCALSEELRAEMRCEQNSFLDQLTEKFASLASDLTEIAACPNKHVKSVAVRDTTSTSSSSKKSASGATWSRKRTHDELMAGLDSALEGADKALAANAERRERHRNVGAYQGPFSQTRDDASGEEGAVKVFNFHLGKFK